MSFYFEAFPVSYPQCAGGGSLTNQEIERVYCCIKDLIYVLGRPSNYYHQPVLSSLCLLVENFQATKRQREYKLMVIVGRAAQNIYRVFYTAINTFDLLIGQ